MKAPKGLQVLVATKSVEVFQALRTIPDLEIRPALTTEQIAQLIPTAQLAIIDPSDVVEHGYEVGRIQTILSEAQEAQRIAWTKSSDFLTAREYWIEQASRVIGGINLPKKFTIGLSAYSGGVGKTTLALDTALHFARCTEQPVLLVEFVYGASALSAITQFAMPYLYDLITKADVQPAVYQKVTMIPMDYDNCRLLPAAEVGKYLKRQFSNHVLSVIDAIWPHGLLGSVVDEVNRWLVVTTPRLDAIENAKKLQAELGSRAAVVLNQKRGAADSLALSGLERGLDLPYVERVDQWNGRLGRDLLRYVYGSTWRQHEKSENVFAALGRRLTHRGAGDQLA